MPIYTSSIDYSINGGRTFVNYTSSYEYSSSFNAAFFNINFVPYISSSGGVVFRTYKSGSDIGSPESDTQLYYAGGTQLKFSTYYSVHEYKYMCVVKRSEFNSTLNVTLYDNSGSKYTTLETLDTSGSIIKLDTTDENFTPYATTIGLYDDAQQLVAYAKFANPIKITRDFDSVFIVKFDV
jgi:hypothetical protein